MALAEPGHGIISSLGHTSGVLAPEVPSGPIAFHHSLLPSQPPSSSEKGYDRDGAWALGQVTTSELPLKSLFAGSRVGRGSNFDTVRVACGRIIRVC